MPIDLKGKQYVTVNERIAAFRESHPDYALTSEIVSDSDGYVTFKASVYDNEGRLLATGHAQEKEGSSFINKTSHIENCETSAWGRALGNLGYGIDTGIASAEEVANAQLQQKDKPLESEARHTKLRDEYTKYLRLLYGATYNVQEHYEKTYGHSIYEASEAELKKAVDKAKAAAEKKDPTQ